MASFQLKNFVSIVASMINRMKATQSVITDFNVGAIGRTLVEAPAIEIDALYQQAFNLVAAAIPVSVYTSFSFAALPALSATGIIRVFLTAQKVAVLISAGTQFPSVSTQNVYVANSDTIVAPGTTFVDIQVTAATPGASSNVASATAFTMTPAPAGFLSASNAAAFVNGRDLETDAQRLIRFNAFISTLPRGTVAAIAYGLSLAKLTDANGNVTEQVVYQSVIEPYVTDQSQPIALVNAYIHNGVGNTSGALVAAASKILAGYYDANGNAVPGWKAAGVPVNVFVATELPIAVTGTLVAAAGYSHADLVTSATSVITTYLQTLAMGATAIYAVLVQLVMNIEGVANFTLTTPTADTPSSQSTKIMPGTITIS